MIIQNATEAELVDLYTKITSAVSAFDEQLTDDEDDLSEVTVVFDSDSSRVNPFSAGSGYASNDGSAANEGSGSGKCLFTSGVICKRAPILIFI